MSLRNDENIIGPNVGKKFDGQFFINNNKNSAASCWSFCG